MSGQGPGRVPDEIIHAIHSTTAQMVQAVHIARHHHDRLRRNQAVHASVIITPPSGTLTMTGAHAEVRNTSDLIIRDRKTVTLFELKGSVSTFEEVKGSVPTGPEIRLVGWLDEIAFFIPKSIREPFLGDLCEDLTAKAAKGTSRASIWWAAISQVLILVLRSAWSIVVTR